MVYVTPVYAAGEAPVEGVDAAALVKGLKQRGHRAATEIADAASLAEELAVVAEPGDQIVCLGAGDITKWAASLADAIRAARALSPRPAPSTTPQPMARTFLTAPPISAPTTSSDQ